MQNPPCERRKEAVAIYCVRANNCERRKKPIAFYVRTMVLAARKTATAKKTAEAKKTAARTMLLNQCRRIMQRTHNPAERYK